MIPHPRAALVALVTFTATVQAAPSPAVVREATRRFERANELYNGGQYVDALHLYQAAYSLVPSRDILFNLGLAREKTFDYEGCALAFRQYLEGAGDEATRREQAVERLAQCRAHTQVPVTITSFPPTAAVWVGEGAERTLRGRTPARLDLAPGGYLLSIEAPGYVPQSRRISVEEGVHPELDFQLEKLSLVRIEADPAGATVKIDSVAEGVTPLQRELRAGRYRVELAKAGYQTVEREVQVEVGGQLSLVLSLPPEPHRRRLEIATELPRAGAAVILDGDPVGAAPLSRTLLVGAHHLDVRAPDHRPWVGDIRIPEDRDLHVSLRLAPLRTRVRLGVLGALLGAATVMLGVGGSFGYLALEDRARFDDQPSVAARDGALGHAHTADALLGVGAGLAVAGLISYLATLPGRSRLEVVR